MNTIDTTIREASADVHDRVAKIRSRPISMVEKRTRRRSIVLAVATTTALVFGMVAALVVVRPFADEVTTAAELPSVTLGSRHVWPPAPIDGPPTQVAAAFAETVLGWQGAVVTEMSDEPGTAQFLIDHPQAAEPVQVSLMVSGRSWVDEVLPISSTIEVRGQEIVSMGLSLTSGGDIDGIRVDAPMVAGADGAEFTVRLVGGDHIVERVDLQNDVSDRLIVDVPGVGDPEAVVSVLVRYVRDGEIISAAAGLFGGSGW